jgi:hypothetical protein
LLNRNETALPGSLPAIFTTHILNPIETRRQSCGWIKPRIVINAMTDKLWLQLTSIIDSEKLFFNAKVIKTI